MEDKLELVYITRNGSGIPCVVLHQIARESGRPLDQIVKVLQYDRNRQFASPIWLNFRAADLGFTDQWVPVDRERSFLSDVRFPLSQLKRVAVYEIVHETPKQSGVLTVPGLYTIGAYVVAPFSVYDPVLQTDAQILCAQIHPFTGRLLGVQEEIPSGNLKFAGSVHPLALTAGWFGPPERL